MKNNATAFQVAENLKFSFIKNDINLKFEKLTYKTNQQKYMRSNTRQTISNPNETNTSMVQLLICLRR